MWVKISWEEEKSAETQKLVFIKSEMIEKFYVLCKVSSRFEEFLSFESSTVKLIRWVNVWKSLIKSSF